MWAVVSGVCLAPLIQFFVALWLVQTEPTTTEVHKMDVVVVPGEALNRDLRITLYAPMPQSCWRVNQHLLYRIGADGVPVYYPLGSALNGGEFKSPGMPPPGGRFVLVLPLPPSIQHGEYWFVSRAMYSCSWGWGWMARDIPFQTEPVRVVI